MAQGIALAAPRPPNTGRPTLCTPAVIEGMSQIVGSGSYPTVALEGMGIEGACHAAWLHNAQRDYDAGMDASASVFIAYSEAFLKAQAAAEQRLISRVHAAAEAGPQYWPAAMTALERRHPDRWGKRERIEPPQHTTTVQIAFVPFNNLPQPPQVQVLDVPAHEVQRVAPAAPDTDDMGHTPLRICGSGDTGGE